MFLEQPRAAVAQAVEEVAGGSLPATGQEVGLWLWLGGGMIVVGLLLQMPRRRRRPTWIL